MKELGIHLHPELPFCHHWCNGQSWGKTVHPGSPQTDRSESCIADWRSSSQLTQVLICVWRLRSTGSSEKTVSVLHEWKYWWDKKAGKHILTVPIREGLTASPRRWQTVIWRASAVALLVGMTTYWGKGTQWNVMSSSRLLLVFIVQLTRSMSASSDQFSDNSTSAKKIKT